MGTWHDPDLGRPIAAPLERCAQLLGVDLPIVHELAATVAPYLRADGTRIWNLMQLERLLIFPTPRGRQALDDADDRVAEIEQHRSQLVGPARFDDACRASRSCWTSSLVSRPAHETWPRALHPHRQGSSRPM